MPSAAGLGVALLLATLLLVRRIRRRRESRRRLQLARIVARRPLAVRDGPVTLISLPWGTDADLVEALLASLPHLETSR